MTPEGPKEREDEEDWKTGELVGGCHPKEAAIFGTEH